MVGVLELIQCDFAPVIVEHIVAKGTDVFVSSLAPGFSDDTISRSCIDSLLQIC